MSQAPSDLSQRMSVPWAALALGVAGGALMASELDPVFRVLGFASALAGAVNLGLAFRRQRQSFARLLAAIPLADKGEGLYRQLPKAWAALEQANLALRTQVEAEDLIRRNILARLKAGVVLLDGRRRVHVANPAALALLGPSSNLAPGQSLVAAFREPESLRNLEAAFAGGALEWCLKREPRTLQLRATAFPAQGDPEAAWVLVTIDDITRQEALETTRQKFISNASHELKTPVAAIRIAVENLQDGAQVRPEGDANMDAILRSVERMVMLLADISELSRIETGALRLEPVALRLGEFLEDLLDTVQVQAQVRPLRLRLELAEDLEEATFQADPLRLAQLLENLLSNAIKFSPPGGEVRLRAAREGPWLVWTVSDDGPGIAASDAGRIFERFYRAPSVRAVPGTGLGLAIVKHLAMLMDGEVEVASEPGHGATFTFRLPTRISAPEFAATSMEPAPGQRMALH